MLELVQLATNATTTTTWSGIGRFNVVFPPGPILCGISPTNLFMHNMELLKLNMHSFNNMSKLYYPPLEIFVPSMGCNDLTLDAA